MALRILQFGIVFAIGFYLGPASPFAGTTDVSGVPLSILLEDPKDVIVNKSQPASLQCTVKSSLSGSVEISWFHNDKPILNNDTRRYMLEDGILYFPKVVGGKKGTGLTGEYRCLAKNSAGAVLSNPAKLRIASFDRDFSTHPNNLSVPESQPAVLFCNIHSVPSAQIKWEHNNLPLPHNTRYVPLPTGALLITKTHSSDAGSYRCIATNSLLKKNKYSKIVQLEVFPSPMTAEIPQFLPLDTSTNSTVLVGEKINFYCAVTGWPTPTVQWLNSHGIVISNSSVLQLQNVTLRDTGIYSCVAYNSEGRTVQQYSLEVHQKPYFNVTPTSRSYPSARTVRLDCQAKGVPEPKISWMKDGKLLAIGGRIKKQPTGLVFSHTFTYDSGIYQCIASNVVGKIWAAAQLVLSSSNTPSPPEDVKCRSYNESSICLSWRPPKNVSAQAYSIYSFYTAMGPAIIGPEYVTNMTHQLASGLNSSTNYTFYVRLYSNTASDQSKKVTCETVVKGKRDLRVSPVNKTTIELTWAKVSTDVPCDGTKVIYKVQWRRRGRSAGNFVHVEDLSHVISGLTPLLEYEFRVTSTHFKNDNSRWVSSILYSEDSKVDSFHNNSNNSELVPFIPERLEGNPISSTSINVSWTDPNGNSKYYTVCYNDIEDEEEDLCEDGNLTTSTLTSLQINNLHPDTLYEIRVRAHNSEEYASPYSQPLKSRTLSDVPSAVLDLKYKLVNETTVCLQWQPPLHKNGKLTKYVISYTPDYNWPLEKWICQSVPSTPKKSKACWSPDDGSTSALLVDLKPDKQYTVLVRAGSEVGLGKPTMPIVVTTTNTMNTGFGVSSDDYNSGSQNVVQYSQKLGIIVGVAIAIACVIICISCIVVRRQCLKTRALARARLTASNNYYPAIAHYASEGSSVQVRLESPCSAEIHEIEKLVSEDSSMHVPSVTPTHLDTKGSDGFPNGHINGSAKPYINGHILNGSVHITENPRYYALECNGHLDKKQKPQEKLTPRFEEDSNSNLKTSKFQDLHRIFENSKLNRDPPMTKQKTNNHQCNSHPRDNNSSSFKNINTSSLSSSSEDGSLNSAQDLDNYSFIMSVNNHRRISPILGPNG